MSLAPRCPERNVVRDGRLCIDAAEGRRWHDHLRTDPRARVRFHGRVHPLRAVLVGRPGELPGFDPDRFAYRLGPRAGPGAPGDRS